MNQQHIRQGVWTVCGVALSNSSVPPAMVVACMAIHAVRRGREPQSLKRQLTSIEGWRSVHGSTGTGAADPNPRPHGLPARMADSCASAPASRDLGHGLKFPLTIDTTIRVHSCTRGIQGGGRIAYHQTESPSGSAGPHGKPRDWSLSLSSHRRASPRARTVAGEKEQRKDRRNKQPIGGHVGIVHE